MFDANAGFFYLVFANMADDYYTAHYIKTDFLSYLRLQLIEGEFRYLCFVSKTPFDHQCEYRFTLTGGLNISELQQVSAHRISLFKGGRRRNDSWNPQDCSKKSLKEVDLNTLREYMINILNKMSEQKHIAVVCPLDIFSACCEDEGVVKALVARQKNPNHNIMILTGSVNAADHDVYFRRLAVQSNEQKTSIFANGRLFPNIEKHINCREKLTKLIFTYDLLKSAFGERMLILNDLSFEKLCLLVRYVVMRENQVAVRYSPDCYAAVVYAWYENERFRCQYSYLNLPDNPFRKTRIVAEAIAKKDFFESANKVLQDELKARGNDEAKAIADSWCSDNKGAQIVYDVSVHNERIPEMRNYLIAFRRKLKGHEELLENTEWRDIEMMVEYFSRPSYSLYADQSRLPHERCVDYKSKIDELYDYLKKDVWNSWDDSAMKLLFLMYKRCYEHTKETEEKTMDRDSYLGKLEFEKCIESIELCILKSKSCPGESNMSKYFYNETKQILCCENPDIVRRYRASGVLDYG